MHEDAAAALGAVGDGQAVDARRIAQEVARERIGSVRSPAGSGSRFEIAQQSAVPRSGRTCFSASRIRRRRILLRRNSTALRQHRDSGAFESSHQRGLLQQLGQVAVQRGVPAEIASSGRRSTCGLLIALRDEASGRN